ncbi:MAG TPA: YetF domain-containing protein [Clostridia bacterium]|nr:YetF domain-containing protein [Clostridia bacterium]
MINIQYWSIVLSSASVYIFIIVAIRLFGKKELSQLSVVDLVFILLISNAVQNAMVGPDTTLQGGLVAAGTLFAVNYLLKLVLYKFPRLGQVIQGEPVILVYKGEINHKNMVKVKFTLEELKEAIREHGVSLIEDVDLAVLETDGNISIISNDFKNKTVKKRKPYKLNNKASGNLGVLFANPYCMLFVKCEVFITGGTNEV